MTDVVHKSITKKARYPRLQRVNLGAFWGRGNGPAMVIPRSTHSSKPGEWVLVFDGEMPPLNIHRDPKDIVGETKDTNRKYQELVSPTKKTTSRDLVGLVEKEIFSKVGTTGKGTYYISKKTKGT